MISRKRFNAGSIMRLFRDFGFHVGRVFAFLHALVLSILCLPEAVLRCLTFAEWRRLRFSSTPCLNVIVNGPSLDPSLIARDCDSLCVNEFVLTDLFCKVRPRFYVLLDPKYGKENVEEAYGLTIPALNAKTKWPLTLFIPIGLSATVNRRISNSLVKVCPYPLNWFDCHFLPPKLRVFFYRVGWMAPPASNVLVHALYLSLHLGYKSVFLHGASMSFFRDISLDDLGRPVLDSDHFYGRQRECASMGMSGFFLEQYQSFLSFHDLRLASLAKSVSIVNLSSNSFIDSFPRS